MKIRLTILFIMGVCANLIAEDINIKQRYSLESIHSVIINQENLKALTFGICFLPVKTVIRSHKGDELILLVRGRSTIGRLNPISLEAQELGNRLELSMIYKNASMFGINIGQMDIEILVPEHWNNNLELKKISTETNIYSLRQKSLSGSTSMAKLNIYDSDFDQVNLDFGNDTRFSANSVNAEHWKLKGVMGDISVEKVKGEMEIQTFDGDIRIEFTEFQGKNSFSSKMGSISIIVPDNAAMDLSLTSTTESVTTNLFVTDSIQENSKKRISGTVGSSSNALHAMTWGGKVRVFTQQGR